MFFFLRVNNVLEEIKFILYKINKYMIRVKNVGCILSLLFMLLVILIDFYKKFLDRKFCYFYCIIGLLFLREF